MTFYPATHFFRFGERKQSLWAKSGAWGSISKRRPWSFSATTRDIMCRHIIVMEDHFPVSFRFSLAYFHIVSIEDLDAIRALALGTAQRWRPDLFKTLDLSQFSSNRSETLPKTSLIIKEQMSRWQVFVA